MGDYYDNIRKRAEGSFQNRPIADFLDRIKAIVGPAAAELQGPAQEALDAIRQNREPSPKQLAALELVIRTMRPAPLSKQGELPDLEQELASIFVEWEAFRVAVKPHLYTIGRIDQVRANGVGTGFLVSKTLLITNKHVLDVLSFGTNRLEQGQAVVLFREEYNSSTEKAVDIVGVAAVHDTLDMALLRIEDTAFEDDRVPLSLGKNDSKVGNKVVTIGYPLNDKARNPFFIGAIFGDRFGVKRAAPGEIIDTHNESIFHDCSTLGGNSGSPVIAIDTLQVVGIHRSGLFTYRNEAVNGKSLSDFVDAHI
ncbi:MAG: serine protease Do [Acidobacteriota bacterium]|jgi:endonuclease G